MAAIGQVGVMGLWLTFIISAHVNNQFLFLLTGRALKQIKLLMKAFLLIILMILTLQLRVAGKKRLWLIVEFNPPAITPEDSLKIGWHS
ncbi:MAG TPA: hypothetical protein VG737_11155 [Cyclobacteriaceae bacterium]|nr:hypothetical protein [Cyclobacteriaceae bacterium]